jgi:ribose transport system permease protein
MTGSSSAETGSAPQPANPDHRHPRASVSASADTSGNGRHGRLRPAISYLMRSDNLWILAVLLVLIVGFSFATPYFVTQGSWVAISVEATEVLLLAVGETFVIVARGIDLSVGANLGFSAFVGAWVMSKMMTSGLGTDGILAIGAAATLGTGMLVGFINGFVITVMNVTPFIATLGTLGAATGGMYVLNGGQEISSIPGSISAIGNTNIAGGWLPVPVLVTAVVVVIAMFILRRTQFGRHTYAVGSNTNAALRAGINIRRHLTYVYVLSGGLAGLSGFLLLARLSVASVNAGQNDELNAIAAVVIGGASLFGGKGKISGAVIGTAIIAVINTGLIIANIDPSWQVIAVGIILVVAVWTDQQRAALAKRFTRRTA